MDYSARTAFKRNRRDLWKMTEEIDDILDGPPPRSVDFTDVGDLVEAKGYIEKALRHLRDYKNSR